MHIHIQIHIHTHTHTDADIYTRSMYIRTVRSRDIQKDGGLEGMRVCIYMYTYVIRNFRAKSVLKF